MMRRAALLVSGLVLGLLVWSAASRQASTESAAGSAPATRQTKVAVLRDEHAGRPVATIPAPSAPARAAGTLPPEAQPDLPGDPRVTCDAAGDQRFNGARVFGRGQAVTLERLPDGSFRRQLAALPPVPRQRALAALQRQCIPEADFASLQVDRTGHLLYACALIPPPPPVTAPRSAATPRGTLVPVSASPIIRHSRPGSSKVLYLAFHGPTISGTAWNEESGIASYSCLPWSDDADRTTFSTSELQTIATIWERIAEDYAPFDIDVTTELPAVWNRTTGAVVFTPTIDANGHALPHDQHGGIAYLNVFGYTDYSFDSSSAYSPAWVTAYSGYSASYMAEAAAHEFGHNLGLSHDGTTSPTTEYYTGHEAFAGTGIWWNTIMGGGSFNDVSQWSRGEYYHANNPEDDLATIAGKLAYRAADHGASAGAATAVTASGSLDFSGSGVIERSNGADWFSFSGTAGTLTIDAVTYRSANGWQYGGDLDLRLELYDAGRHLIASNDTAGAFDASLTATIATTAYYLKVTVPGATVGTPLAASPSGYTTYGVLGQYSFTGRIAGLSPGSMAVSGAGLAIANGDGQPDAADGSAFGMVAVGGASSHTFTLANHGGQALTVDTLQALTLPGGVAASPRFTIASTAFPGALAAGAEGQFTITYAPAALADDSAEIVLRSGTDAFRFQVAGSGGTAPPTLSAITPTAGSTAGGTLVTITGQHLDGAAVTFGGSAAVLSLQASDHLVAIAPAHAAGTVAVQVATGGGSGAAPTGFTYLAPPTISSVTPDHSPLAGGVAITISGSGLAAAEVSVDGVMLVASSVSATRVVVTSPPHAAGAVQLALTTPGGELTTMIDYQDEVAAAELDAPAGGGGGGCGLGGGMALLTVWFGLLRLRRRD